MQQVENNFIAEEQNDDQKNKDKSIIGNKSPHQPIVRQRCLFTANPVPKVCSSFLVIFLK